MAFDLCMQEHIDARGAVIQIVIGQNGSGKSVYAQEVLRRSKGLSLAIDDVCFGKPSPKHISYYADLWTDSASIRSLEKFDPRVKLLAADEAALFLPSVGGRKADWPCVQDALYRGRHLGLSLVLCVQRPTKLDRGAWTQAQRYVIFRTDERDLEPIEGLGGMTQAALRMIPQLPPGYAVVVDQFDGLFYPEIPEWRK